MDRPLLIHGNTAISLKLPLRSNVKPVFNILYVMLNLIVLIMPSTLKCQCVIV